MTRRHHKESLLGADNRPRIHLWPSQNGFSASLGATGARWSRAGERSAGEALNNALGMVNPQIRERGVVVIIEPIDG